ncbi:MAG: restriction endonuclease subunit S [Planctomycetaceae bacterium]|nr:restriction endonuclease subunit S [Planctomycetaceae bacterium]
MKGDTKHTLIPKLRFPEFRDSWIQKPLAQIATLIDDRVGTTQCTPYTVTTGVGLVSQENKFGRTIAGDSLKNYLRLKKNDFAYNKSATKAFPQGYIARYLGKDQAAVPNSIFTCFRPDELQIDPAYLDYVFAGNLHGRWLKKYITIGARAHGSLSVNDDDLMRLPVPVPSGSSSSAEQQKIADCLTSLDELIAAEVRKLEAMRAHKQGLMQLLFPREGETRSRLRFPEFCSAPAWEMYELGPMTSRIGSGITPLGGDKNYKSSGRPFIRSQNVGWGELILEDVAYIDEETHKSFVASEIQPSDVLLNITGASIGRSAVADSRIVGGNVNQHVCIIRLKQNELYPVLLNQYLISDRGQKQIDNFQAGGNRQGLNFGQIRSFLIPRPPTKGEQQRVAGCLASLDTVMLSQATKVVALRVHKRGLMQQLFPSPQESEA